MGVHRTEEFTNHFVRIRPITVGHILDGNGEEVIAFEDVRVFGEEQEDQTRHEVVHLLTAFGGSPLRIIGPQGDIEFVQPQSSPNVELRLAELLCFVLLSPASGQKKTKWLGRSS